MKFVTSPGPFIRNPLAKTRQAMLEYTIGLLGLFSFSVGFHWLTHGMEYGIKAIGMMVTSLLVTLLADMFAGILQYQYHHGRLLPYVIKFIKGNYSYVTAVLMTLTLPIGTPYFVVIIANLFATLIVKYAFGGFGANIFNPAAFGRIFVGLAFGAQLTAYIQNPSDVPSLQGITGETITSIFNSTYPGWLGVSLEGMPVSSLWQLYLGNYSGALGETSVIMIVLLGSILTILKAHNWRPTVFFLMTIWLSALAIALVSGLPPLTYAFTFVGLGSVFFGGMFMLTDPVTSPTTNFGKALIGVIAGFVVVIIRTQTGLPEGVVYGIAVANLASPVIDKFTTGLINQFLRQRYALLSGLVFVSMATSSFNTYALINQSSEGSTSLPNSTGSQSSSSATTPTAFKIFTGQATSYYNDDTEDDMTVMVQVGVDRSFNIEFVEVVSGIISSGSDINDLWQEQNDAVLASYQNLSVRDIKQLQGIALPPSLELTGLTYSAARLYQAVYNAFFTIDVFTNQAASLACSTEENPDYDPCYDTMTTLVDVYVDTQTDSIEGLAIRGEITTDSTSYINRYNNNKTTIQDFYIGESVFTILARDTPPIYPGFIPANVDPTQTGITFTLDRIFQAIQLALALGYPDA